MKLKDYATSKKDMKRGVEIVPEENYRLRNEDFYEPDQAKFGSKGSGSIGSNSTNSSSNKLKSDLPDEYSEVHGFREPSQTLYARAGDKKVGL